MFTGCKAAGLPEPEFTQCGGEFVVTIWRDWLTDAAMAAMDLNDRQKQAIRFVKEKGRINNSEYRKLTDVTDRTALRDLKNLCDRNIFRKEDKKGKATEYILVK